MPNIIIHHRSVHHAQNSGYGQLANYIDGETLPYLTSKFPYKLAKYCSSLIKPGAGTYDTMSIIKDYELCKKILLNRNKGIIHYLNAERDIRFGIQLNKIKKNYKFVGTFHKPLELFDSYFTDIKFFKKLDGVITVGNNQVDFLKSRLDIDKVKYIPHGIDTTFFYPDAKIKNENTLLFVGQHLRDFDAFNFVICRLKEKIPTIKVNVVIRQDFTHLIKPNSAITIHTGIDDGQLRLLYQEATLLFLPLITSTACNSILEALACGLPIISTNVGGNKGYVDENCGILLPSKDYQGMVDTVASLLSDSEKLNRMAYNCRKKAEEMNWEKVAKQIEEFYDSI